MNSTRRPRRMDPVVAVSWHHGQLLAVVARCSTRGIEIVDTATLTLETGAGPDEIGAAVKQLIARHRIRRFRLMIGLPRSFVDIVGLRLPPASDAELPSMVRNEVARNFPDLSDDAIVDFRTTSQDSPASRVIEAAVLRPEHRAQIETFAAKLGQRPERIVLRTLSIASLFARLAGHAHPKSLLLNVMEYDVDLSLFVRQEVVFSRTVRWTTESLETECAGDAPLSDDRVQLLVDEIRRTVAVAPREGSDAFEVEHIYMFGNLKSDGRFIESLADDLETPVSLLDPLVGIQLADGVSREIAGRLPALIGMLHDSVNGLTPIDFANPKQPPAPRKYGRKIAFYATAATIVMALGIWHFGTQLGDVMSDQRALQQELSQLNRQLVELRKRSAPVDAVDVWRGTEIHWLNELARLSANFPSSDEAVIGRLTAAPAAGGAGIVSMSVRVSEPAVIQQLESSLRDERHQVSSKRISQTTAEAAFPCQFDTSLVVKPAALESRDDALATVNRE